MWTRADLKQKGKNAFKRNYWKCVLVALILSIFVNSGGGGTLNYSDQSNNTINYNINQLDGDEWEEDVDDNENSFSELSYRTESDTSQTSLRTPLISLPDWMQNISYTPAKWMTVLKFGILNTLGLSIGIAAILLSIFVFSMFEIGGCSFFIKNALEQIVGETSVGELLFAFRNGTYGKMVLTQFLKSLYTLLWTLLLIIPGIVKHYEYRMIPYLLADFPEMSKDDAFRISKEMMNGNKMNAFILDLSFIGWHILSAVTLGIVGIFYVNPYVNATNAELYLTLKKQHFGTNSTSYYNF